MKPRYLAIPILAVVALVAAGCGDDKTSTPAPGGTTKAENALVKKKNELMSSMASEIGAGEGAVDILAWPYYAENGTKDPASDWVGPFEQASGCKANILEFGTSDEAVSQISQGNWDVVSASGDATLRLIAAGKVAPVNTKLLDNYADIAPFLKDRPWNSVDGQMFGVPHGWGANLLMYNTDVVKPAPDSWSVVFDPASPNAGKVTAYDSPIYIADAAMYLKATKPDLKITDPYALDDTQFTAAVDLLKSQKKIVGEYWSDSVKSGESFKAGSTVLGTTWQVTANTISADSPVKTVEPKEGMTGWSDTWMVTKDAKHPNCAYQWMNWITKPDVQAQVAELFGEAPANLKACDVTTNKDHCTTFHAADEAYSKGIYYWNTPTKDCLDGRTGVTCKDYQAWKDAWTEIRG